MLGYYVACPHCSGQLYDDGSLVGQLVMCPNCRGQFQMPMTLPAGVQPVIPSVVTTHSASSEYRRSFRRRRPNKAGLYITLALITIGGFSLAWIGNQIEDHFNRKLNPEPATQSWHDKGYERGFGFGRSDSNNPHDPDPELAFLNTAFITFWVVLTAGGLLFMSLPGIEGLKSNTVSGAVIGTFYLAILWGTVGFIIIIIYTVW